MLVGGLKSCLLSKPFLKAKPKTEVDVCNQCGICADNCPKEAKYFDDEAFLSHVKMLESNYNRRVESVMFL